MIMLQMLFSVVQCILDGRTVRIGSLVGGFAHLSRATVGSVPCIHSRAPWAEKRSALGKAIGLSHGQLAQATNMTDVCL